MREMWTELDAQYCESSDASYELEGMAEAGAAFLLARDRGRPIGCAALRPMSRLVAEVKRVYVQPEMRRAGVARRLMLELEILAREAGFRELWLETGIRQPASIQLYETLGYFVIPPYGKYKDKPWSVCYAKRLE